MLWIVHRQNNRYHGRLKLHLQVVSDGANLAAIWTLQDISLHGLNFIHYTCKKIFTKILLLLFDLLKLRLPSRKSILCMVSSNAHMSLCNVHQIRTDLMHIRTNHTVLAYKRYKLYMHPISVSDWSKLTVWSSDNSNMTTCTACHSQGVSCPFDECSTICQTMFPSFIHVPDNSNTGFRVIVKNDCTKQHIHKHKATKK